MEPSSTKTNPNYNLPHPGRTGFFTWVMAIVCAFIWLVVIVAGVIVLVIYLVFHPTEPKVDIASGTLNALYLDGGTFLNADLTLLMNLTNHNSKVHIKFQSISFTLFFDNALIATRAVEPFAMGSHESALANVEFVTSAVYLSPNEVQELQNEVKNNRVRLKVEGAFETGFKLGRLRRVYRWTFWQCNLAFADPPSGALVTPLNCRS
ncbi:hypothetical protein EJ110_NYTH55486 [Nymphaea thermarum]|nr:hypothetical protein EJ110_NYTH55486 [Nymphaea thermarum]